MSADRQALTPEASFSHSGATGSSRASMRLSITARAAHR